MRKPMHGRAHSVSFWKRGLLFRYEADRLRNDLLLVLLALVGVPAAIAASIVLIPDHPIGGWISFGILVPLILTPVVFGLAPGVLAAAVLLVTIPWVQELLGYPSQLPASLSYMLAVLTFAIPVVTGLTVHTIRTLNNAIRHEQMVQQEAHHRIKNSLSLVSSLLGLARFEASETTSTGVLEKAAGHVASIATVHDSLSRSDSFETIELREHLQRLGTNLEEAGYCKALMEIDGPAVVVNGDTAVALGLVLNELITNARKHGSAGAEFTRIRVAETKAEILLYIEQPDAKLPEGFSFETEGNGLGIDIVRNVLAEYGGYITVTRHDPAGFRVSVKK